MAQPEKEFRFESLDGLRGVFALAVVLFHINFATHFYSLPIIRASYLSVDFFFVLSGFVIAFAHAGRISSPEALRSFVIKRVGRVWPLHIVMLACLVAFELAKLLVTTRLGIAEPSGMPFTGANSPFALLTNAALLQSLDLHGMTTWNYPSWSISAELCAYIIFGVVCLFAGKRALWIAAATVASAIATILAFSHTGMDLTFHLGAVRGCLGFFLGWLAFAAFSRWPVKGNSWSELAIVIVVIAYLSFVGRPPSVLAPLSSPLPPIALRARRSMLTAVGCPATLAVGRRSYSIDA